MMKTAILSALPLISPALAGFDSWTPPGPYDVRAPCPMLNTLANHEFLPHHGKDLTREQTAKALFDALHVDSETSSFLFDFALTTNPQPNATTFSLNDLGNHNVLEHDASLSRADAFFGNVLVFNHTVFEETKTHWTDEIIDIQMAANARAARIKTSQATNPHYEMSDLGNGFTFGESAAYVIFLGDQKGQANRTWLEFWFETERLPLHLGWQRPAELFVQDDLIRWIDTIVNLTETEPVPDPPAPTECPERRKRRNANSHFGW